MVVAKTELFSQNQKASAVFFKALGHPARLAILQYLAGMKVCMTGDICEELPLSRTTVNQHLKELKKAGLIQGTVEGTRVNYCLNPCKIKEFEEIASQFIVEIAPDTPTQCP